MSLLTGTVSLIQLDNIYLAVSGGDTLMIGQSSEVKVLKKGGKKVGSFDYAGTELPAYCLNDQLLPSQDNSLLEQSQFCIGLKTSQEADYFVLLCQSFEQVDLAEKSHNMRELPVFMCNENMLAQGMLEYRNIVYLVTSADKVIDYIANGADHKQENKKNA